MNDDLESFNKIEQCLDLEILLPDNILIGNWENIYFFESDTVLSEKFVQAAKGIIAIEKSNVCCLSNINKNWSKNYKDADKFLIRSTTKSEEYLSKLQLNNSPEAWIYGMDRFGCASPTGLWCMYCERENDVAFIAFRESSLANRCINSLHILSAAKICDLVSNNTRFPFSHFTPKWRNKLAENY